MSGLEPGFQLGHYRILRSLGSGGMADVYEAHDDHLDRTVALKILPVEYCRNPQLVQRFQKEVRAAAKLNHRNIVTVFEVGQQDSWHFFSMRLLTGGDLRERIQRGLSPLEAFAILRELADAFAHAHARGFVHRDVKPENVMFDEQGFPVLTDFGIAKALNAETRMTRTGMTMGTPRYLSPEQASGKPVDARADLYSLGIILHEMLTGRPPYDAEESMAVIFKHVTEPIPQQPADFARYQLLLEKLMAKDANHRIGSAEELIREIDAIAPRAPTGEPKQSQLRTSENPLIAAHLLTPSPLRTPAPKTPRPVTPSGDRGIESGEVIVRPPPVTARAPATTRPAPAPAAAARVAAPVRPAVAPEAADSAPRQRAVWPAALGGGALAIALAAAGVVAYRALQAPAVSATSPPPAAVTAPAKPDAQAAAQREQLRQEQVQRDAAAAEARRKAEEQAAAKKLAEQQAAQKQAGQKQAAELEAKRRAEAEAKQRADAAAEAQRRGVAEAEARRKAAAEAEAKKKAAEADSWAEVEAAAKRRAEEDARQEAAKVQAERNATAAEAARKKKEEAAKQQAEKEADEEAKAKERTRRPTGF